VVVFLLWVFYSAQILFMGAEFTQVYARRYGKGIQPDKNAVRTENPVADTTPDRKLAAERR
jgi:membrane protein